MATNITDFVNVGEKIANLGGVYPHGLALLPVNFESASSLAELRQASEAATIKKLLIAEGLQVDDILDRSQRPPYIKNKSHEWASPIIFVSALLYSQNPMCISLALNVLGNYATDFFRGTNTTPNVKLNIVIEKKDKSCKTISYEGPVDGLKDLPNIVREAAE